MPCPFLEFYVIYESRFLVLPLSLVEHFGELLFLTDPSLMIFAHGTIINCLIVLLIAVRMQSVADPVIIGLCLS